MKTLHANTLNPDSRLVRSPDIFASEIDNELVMMDDAQGLYFGLNPVGRLIWEGLETPGSYRSLIDRLVALYDVGADKCRVDIEPFLIKMVEHDLIRVVSE